MTIGGALSDLNNLFNADDIPFYYKPSIKAVMDTIELSSSENPNRWIPVSERLPEEGEEVLASGYDTYNKRVIISRYQGEQYGFACGLVSAWMPLPKPYREKEE